MTPILADTPMHANPDTESALIYCAACRHRLDEHDATDLRYCDATVSSALTRGCICRRRTTRAD
jgi:hypothetical protein